MDLDGIEVFVKVVEAGSFSQAAKLLGMPNSTVSAKLSALEKRLGVTLLQRSTRKLRATPAGETYFQQCVQALEQLQAAENELTSAQTRTAGASQSHRSGGHRAHSSCYAGARFFTAVPENRSRARGHQPRARPHRRRCRSGDQSRRARRLEADRQAILRRSTSDCGRVLLI